jgi:Mg2+ and Co2+ transporter CorA
VAVRHNGNLSFDGIRIGLLAGRNFVVTMRREPVEFLEALRKRERGDTDLGSLTAESFAASLLDWHLSTYFEAVSAFEASVERLEVDILSGSSAQRLEELQKLRRCASRLRQMLSPHRSLFAALARPDFRPQKDGKSNPHFLILDTHFERAMDMVANTRELVIGSFELFTSHTAWRTNEVIRVLTFFTVLLGALAVIAGVLGMNFDAAFFKTSTRGFWAVLAGMGALALIATLVARRRRWI